MSCWYSQDNIPFKEQHMNVVLAEYRVLLQLLYKWKFVGKFYAFGLDMDSRNIEDVNSFICRDSCGTGGDVNGERRFMVPLWNGFMVCDWTRGKDRKTKTGLIHYLFWMFENKELLIAVYFNFALQYNIWKVQLNQEGLKMSGKHHVFGRNTQIWRSAVCAS